MPAVEVKIMGIANLQHELGIERVKEGICKLHAAAKRLICRNPKCLPRSISDWFPLPRLGMSRARRAESFALQPTFTAAEEARSKHAGTGVLVLASEVLVPTAISCELVCIFCNVMSLQGLTVLRYN